jgi:hypothetical protein
MCLKNTDSRRLQNHGLILQPSAMSTSQVISLILSINSSRTTRSWTMYFVTGLHLLPAPPANSSCAVAQQRCAATATHKLQQN